MRAVLKKWMRKGRLPDAMVIEHPGYKLAATSAPRGRDARTRSSDLRRVLDEIQKVIRGTGD